MHRGCFRKRCSNQPVRETVMWAAASAEMLTLMRCMTAALRPLTSQAAWKPECTLGVACSRLPRMTGDSLTIQACGIATSSVWQHCSSSQRHKHRHMQETRITWRCFTNSSRAKLGKTKQVLLLKTQKVEIQNVQFTNCCQLDCC